MTSSDLLKAVQIFSRMPDTAISELAQRGQTIDIEPHANIVIEGELSGGLFIVLEGTVGIFKHNPANGKTYDLGTLNTGHCFGEMSLVDDNPRSATVKAMTECKLFHLSKDDFWALLQNKHELTSCFYENCTRELIGRLRETDSNYIETRYQLWKAALKGEAA